jgi:ABC-2 type transport system ATP-binding protein
VTDTAVSVRGLRKAYGTHEVVKGIDFEVGLGECFGFLGTNGAGKTTTIEILEGYRPRDGGEISVLGLDPAKPTRAWRERIGLVLQEVELDPNLTVRETIAQFAAFYAKPPPDDETIELVGLREKRGDRVGRLSGGQKRRVDVALGIIGDPDLIFLDEPTTGFDPAARRDAWTMIEGLKALGKTIFLTTHYMDEAQHLADRVCILREGQIVALGSPETLGRGLDHSTVIGFRLPAGVTAGDVEAGTGLKVTLAGTQASVTTSAPQADLYRLTGWAEQLRITLEELTVQRPSLEDVFLELTAGQPQQGP